MNIVRLLLRSEFEFSEEPFITKAICARVIGHDKFASIIAGVRKESAVTALSDRILEYIGEIWPAPPWRV